MKQKVSRDLTEKAENGSEKNAPAHRENILARRCQQKTLRGEKEERPTWGSHMSGSNPRRRPKAAVVAGVEPRRVREIGVYQEVQCVLSRWWVVDLVVGEHHVDGDTFSSGRQLGRWWRTPVVCCNLRIEARVRRRDALESYWQEMGGRGACTGANRAGSRGGSRRPELRKETPSGLFKWLGGVLVECRGGVGTSWSSGPLFIGGSRGWP